MTIYEITCFKVKAHEINSQEHSACHEDSGDHRAFILLPLDSVTIPARVWSDFQTYVRPRQVDSLRGSSVKIGTIQRRLAWPPRKDDTHTHTSRNVNNMSGRARLCALLAREVLDGRPQRCHGPPVGPCRVLRAAVAIGEGRMGSALIHG